MDNNNSIQQSILQKIDHGEVKMTPRYYFIAGFILITLGTLGVICAGTFFVNHIIFMLQHSPSISFLEFGPRGIQPFLQTFPWASALIAILSVILGLLLLRHYDFSYKTDSKTFVIIVICSIIGMGIVISWTGINEQFETFEPVRGLYNRQFDDNAWVAGIITEMNPPYITVFTPNRDIVIVKTPRLLAPHVILMTQLQVTIIGEWDNEIFVAESIRTVSSLRYPKPSGLPVRHMR